ncbi:putative hydro-lyase [Piscinibacter gummiphilus]|uniref:Uncharacterized protein n=1 Tax=Piscinibacter gummiphilus TaxID=946333 RepID=A0A1W6L392_9BURK|nr:DUF1445 domain-containing protein [Piscinibacter gummiphilus]ARN18744.1 hypothetical protein A4W93_01750 [Piscinibacter gummiphilus]ATU63384.1 DUF1445 domain-containing protein [Piscinibacter gummiphilus]GLS95896.1 UPF0317 protein [Piscinibacter gummiphilus]
MTAVPDFDTNSPKAVRAAIRSGAYRGFTNAVARRHVQGNLMVVPAAHADDFAAYCALNPRALPVLGRSRPGSPFIPSLGEDLDLRTDTGGYMVFRGGELVDTPCEVASVWRDDLVAFVLGCSFSFEGVLQHHGVRLRHLDEGNVSAMYETGIATRAAGPFGGPLVVSMRALRAADAIRAIGVSRHYPEFHGEPVHLGDPSLIGIADLADSYGGHGLKTLHADELPVFWACGATAQTAALQARLPLCITHFKAHMVVTDLPVDMARATPSE